MPYRGIATSPAKSKRNPMYEEIGYSLFQCSNNNNNNN